ncbi:MAG: DUF6788 family protein [Nitriliruptoraceae bacterium]
MTAQPSAELPTDTLAELEALREQIAEIGFTLPGTVTERYTRCTSTNCRCQADPPQRHGPYLDWTRKVAGKTVTRRLSRDQYERYQPWFDNARRLRQLTSQLEELSLRTIEEAESW